MREQTFRKGVIKFSIDEVITNINNSNVTYSDLNNELKNINNDNIQSKLQQLGEGDINRRTTADQNRDGKQNNETIVDMDEQAKSQDFFQDNNAIGKKYTTTCIKSINFLSNIAYVGIGRGLLQQKLYIRRLFTIN